SFREVGVVNAVRANITWPADVGEERSALGACVIGQAAEAVSLLEAADFSVAANREIFAAISDLVRRGEAHVEIGLLAAELRARETLDGVGGQPYLQDLTLGVVS